MYFGYSWDKTVEGRENEEKEKEVKKKIMEKVVENNVLYEGHPCLVAFVYESDNNVVSQRLVEKLKLPTTFHPNQARIKVSK